MTLLRPSRRASAWFVGLFFLALALIGLFTSADYGQPWDEPWEQDILRMNGNQYAAALGVEARFAMRSNIPAPASGLIADSEERDHGECAYYPLLWLMGDHSLSELSRMTVWHAYTWLLFLAGVAALWLICRRLALSRLLSSVAALLYVLTPRMFAEGHYNNKDVVLLTLVLLTVWLALRLMESPTPLRAALFSLAGAAAANTKIIGLLVWGMCALAVLARQIAGRRMTGRVWRAAAVTMLAFAGFYALLTPALWADPLGYLRYVFVSAMGFNRWPGIILFRGALFNPNVSHLPPYYLPYMILVTTPLWILALIAVGQALAVRRWIRMRAALFADDTSLALLLCTVLWLAPLLYAVLGHPLLYNGWRHFYFIYGPMLALAAYGLGRVAAAVRRLKAPHWRRAGAGALALCMAATGTQILLSHPTQYTYYNLLTARRNLPTFLELDYWNVSVLSTLQKLLAQTDADEPLRIAGAEYWSQQGLLAAQALLPPEDQARLRVMPQSAAGAMYLISNSTYATIGCWTPPRGATQVAVTQSYGWPLCTVYRRAN